MTPLLSRAALCLALEFQATRILVEGGVMLEAIDFKMIEFQTGKRGEGILLSSRRLGFCERVTWQADDRYTDRLYRVSRSARQVARRLATRARAATVEAGRWKVDMRRVA